MEIIRYRHVQSVLNLNPTTRRWSLPVKILSIWSPPSHKGLFMYHMLLADSTGNRIDATVPPVWYKKNFKRDLVEGNWYILSDFHVIKSLRLFPGSGHSYQVKCYQLTDMNPIPSQSTSNFFNLASFENITTGDIKVDICHDAFGLLLQVDQVQRLPYAKNKDEDDTASSWIRFELVNSSGVQVTCYAFGSTCEQFLLGMRNEGNEAPYTYIYGMWPEFCLLRFWEVEDCNGELCLTSLYGCSRIFLNPVCPELDYEKFMFDFRDLVDPEDHGEVVDDNFP